MDDQIRPVSLSRKGRVMILLIILGLLSMWILAIYAYLTLPQEVAVHFGFSGEPTTYDDKSTFFILPAALSIAPLIFLLLTKYRFTLINRYPYLINLPVSLTEIPKDKRGFWINRLFEILLGLGIVLTFSLLLMEFGIYLGTLSGKLPVWLVPFLLSMPIWLMFPFFLFFGKLSQEMKEDVDNV